MKTSNTIPDRMQIYSLDELFPDAARLVVMMQEASRSTLMKQLRIGAAKAERLLAQLEAKGIVGQSSLNQRKVLVSSLLELENICKEQ